MFHELFVTHYGQVTCWVEFWSWCHLPLRGYNHRARKERQFSVQMLFFLRSATSCPTMLWLCVMEMSSSLSSSTPSAIGANCSSVPSVSKREKVATLEVSVSRNCCKIYTCLHSWLLGGFARARVGNVVLAFTMDVEATIAALETLLKKSFKELTTKVAHSRLRVWVDDKCVRDLNAARHFLLDPKRTAGANGRPAVFLNTRTGAAARRAVGHALHKRIRD